MEISLRELMVRTNSLMTIVSGRLGLDWGKDETVKDVEAQGFLHPTQGTPVDMKLTLKAQPKKEVVSIALAKSDHTQSRKWK